MRFFLPIVAIGLLSACQPPVPNDTVGGVGFESYAAYQKRQAALANRPVQPVGPGPVNQLPAAVPPSGGSLVPMGTTAISSAPLSAVSPQAGSTSTTIPAQPAAPAPMPATAAAPVGDAAIAASGGISDEQDFNAVAARETIESDKQRIDQNKALYQEIAPTELPQRSGASAGPDLIEYAINAPNRLGQSYYKRGRGLFSKTERACARYDTPEDAQMAFLKAGGPQRDRKNLDPDGDGFACFWDPTPFQKVRG